MKKIILVFTFITLIVFSLQAQVNSKKSEYKKVTFGLRTGYEFQANTSDLEYQLKAPYLGGFADISISDNRKLSLQVELNLRFENRIETLNDNTKFSADEIYFTAPVFLKYKLNPKFNIYAGSQILTIGVSRSIYGIKKFNGIVGFEYNFAKNLFLDARFRHGFEETDINNFRDNRISIGIGYRF